LSVFSTPGDMGLVRIGEGEKAKPCYTGFALSDLDVSGGLPLLIKAIQPGTDFPQAPTA
jgi:hypothetical protein